MEVGNTMEIVWKYGNCVEITWNGKEIYRNCPLYDPVQRITSTDCEGPMLYEQGLADCFINELGKEKDYVATLQVDPTVQPKFYKTRPVSFAMKHKVETELLYCHKATSWF